MSNATWYFLGQMIGGIAIIFFVYWIFLKGFFEKRLSGPVKPRLASLGTAYLVCSSLRGFGAADGGPYAWHAFLDYIIPALLVGAFAFWRGIKENQGTTYVLGSGSANWTNRLATSRHNINPS